MRRHGATAHAASAHAAEGAPAVAFTPTTLGWAARIAVPAVTVALIFALPVWVPYEYQANLVSIAAIYACVGLSMNVLMGYLGLLSLGHQAFFGIGAFAGAILTSQGQPMVVGLAAGTATGLVAALLLGYLALRIKGLYLAIVTLAYGLIAESTLFRIGSLPGGVIADRPSLLASPRAYAYLCLLVLAALYLADWRLAKSRLGRAMLAVRADERVAASFAIDVTGVKLLAFIMSGSTAGLAGALFAHLIGAVTSAQFSLMLGITFVLMTVLGGLRNRAGIVAAATMIAVLDELLRLLHEAVWFIPEPNPLIVPIIASGLLIATLIVTPGGMGQHLAPLQQWIRGGRFDPHAGKRHAGGGLFGRA